MGKIINDKYPDPDDEDRGAVRQRAIAALNLTQRTEQAALQDDDGEKNVNTALSEGIRKLAWQHPEWPDDVYNASAFTERVEAFYRSAERIAGQVQALSPDNQENAVVDLMLFEAITASAIGGENLDRDSVRSSLLKLLGRETLKAGRRRRRADF